MNIIILYGLCKCHDGSKSNRIDCSNALLKNGKTLDTAFLKLNKKKEGFVAEEVDLSHNEIQLLRKVII